ncbi:MAG: type IV toxin-antitoxin system AbiEi family antitoxin domain-containing protein [Elusimicrobia bacterium]|nr:type IV toxin-antitoxin system AbiEi family antitoxin domain-containing protein [Elusimicrobiota bacterium]
MERSPASLIKLIQDHDLRVFTTSDLVTLTGLSATSASHALAKLASQGLLAKIKRGLWANQLIKDLNPLEAVAQITAPWPSYVSLYSALADYGIVEEIPQAIYAVTSARPMKMKTPVGSFHIHHLPSHLIWGYEIKRAGPAGYPMAEPEKAFLDLVYLALIPRSPIQLPHKRGRRWNLDKTKLSRYARRFNFKPMTGYLKQNSLLPF